MNKGIDDVMKAIYNVWSPKYALPYAVRRATPHRDIYRLQVIEGDKNLRDVVRELKEKIGALKAALPSAIADTIAINVYSTTGDLEDKVVNLSIVSPRQNIISTNTEVFLDTYLTLLTKQHKEK